MRFAFFLLLVLNAALGAHLWLTETRVANEDPKKREINPESLKLVAVADPKAAASTAARVNAAKQLAENVVKTGACVEIAQVKPADAARVQQALGGLEDRVQERKLEEPSRWWVYLAPAANRATAEANVAALKRQGIKDISLQADNAVSLGVFSSDDAAARYLAEVQAKGAKAAQKAPRSMQVKEHQFMVREPDTNLVARLTLLQADMEGITLKAVACGPAPSGTAPTGAAGAATTSAPTAPGKG